MKAKHRKGATTKHGTGIAELSGCKDKERYDKSKSSILAPAPASKSGSNSSSSGTSSSSSSTASPTHSTMKNLIGFDLKDFSSTESFVRLCHTPADASCLAAFRIAFGALMVLDCIHERGLSHVVDLWSMEYEVCRFPLFDFLEPLPVAWMAILYLVMGAGAAGMMLGLFFRFSSLMFVLPYWYLFLLDKTAWNNHSYLFGLTATLLLFTDANRYWSVDSWLNPGEYKTDIPVWNYGLLRFQLILVYFVAGLKKLDKDWVHGYSMSSLSNEWVFDPFRSFLTDEQIDQYIVHWGGLFLDLTSGFLLYFDHTRWLGTAMATSFHFMNSRIFAIGQFPYVMICTTTLFYPYDWPKKVFPARFLSAEPNKQSTHCLYGKEKSRAYHKFCSMLTVYIMLWQSFMPYSHFITQGYNNWSGGLYGYSWDMMIHNWRTQHIKITYVNKTTREEGFLDPSAFVSHSERWAAHPDMVRQHARCIAKILDEDYGVTDIEIYMDVWLSMNKRFHQRILDPTVDLLTVDWSPFRPASFMLPLLNDLEGWRTKLNGIAQDLKNRDEVEWFLESPDTTFVADFPGMVLENYIHEDMVKTNITLLVGSAVLFNQNTNKNMTLEINKPLRVGVGTHKVYVTSDIPACYMYMYSNSTYTKLQGQLMQLEQDILDEKIDNTTLEEQAEKNDTLRKILDLKNERQKQVVKNKAAFNKTFWQHNYDRAYKSYRLFRDSAVMSFTAIESIITGNSMEDLVESKFKEDTEGLD